MNSARRAPNFAARCKNGDLPFYYFIYPTALYYYKVFYTPLLGALAEARYRRAAATYSTSLDLDRSRLVYILELGKMKILCLHGVGSSGAILERQMANLRRSLDPSFELTFVDGPFECERGPGMRTIVGYETVD